MAFVKLWLVDAQDLTAIAGAGHDDRLFLNIADALMKGDWLGSYNNLTLAKGPFYPAWIAAVSRSGIPLLLAQHLLYISACFLFILAVKPLLRSPFLILLLYTVLVFNPMSYSQGMMTQLLREGIYPALTLLSVSCSAGLLVRSNGRLTALVCWATGLGVTLSAFWLTREEGVWIVPSVLLLAGFAAPRMWKSHGIKSLFVLLLPLALITLINSGVAGMNKLRYGLFVVNELKSSEFRAAYGALLRVEHDEYKDAVPVPQSIRYKIYEVSPAFSELRPFLEGDIGKVWIMMFENIRRLYEENPDFAKKVRMFLNKEPTGIWEKAVFEGNSDILGGWFLWALRDSVAAAGYYASGPAAAGYYQRLAAEVNTACSEGRLHCLGERSSLTPPWRGEYIPLFQKTFVHSVFYLSRFEGFDVQSDPSIGDEKSLKIFRDITRERLSPTEFLVKGWIFSSDRQLDISVRKADGTLLRHPISHLPSPDVYGLFLSNGMDVPNARNARFEVSLEPYNKTCYLHLNGGGSTLKKIPLDGSVTRLDSDGFYFGLDFRGFKDGSSRKERVKLGALRRIGGIYQSVMPFLVFGSLAGYVISWLSIIRRRTDVDLFITASSLILALVTRSVILSIIHVTSFPAIIPQYLSPSYPLLILFAVLALAVFPAMIRENLLHIAKGRRK